MEVFDRVFLSTRLTMTARVEPARVKLLEAGDHALSDFDDHLPDILDFLGLAHDDVRMQI